MKGSWTRLVVIAGCVALASPLEGQSAQQSPNPFHGPAAEDVRARETAFAQTMADRDFDAFLTFVSPEAIFFAGNTPLRGKEAVAEAWRGFFEGEAAPFSWGPDLVQVLESGTLALSSGPVYGPDGQEGGRFNSIWRLEDDGQWYVIFDKGS